MTTPSQNPSSPPPSESPDITSLDQLLRRQDADNARMRKLLDLMDETHERISETSREITKKKSN